MTGRLTRRRLLAAGALAGLYGMAGGARAASPGALPWRNWSGGLVANPAGRFSPASEDALVDFLKRGTGPVRPVGAGHSFSPLVPTDGHLLVLDRLTGLLVGDAQAGRATFAAGSRLGDLGPQLDGIGQALFNLPDIDRQTLAGATATATHGTGVSLMNLSAYVDALRLVTVGGQVLDVDAGNRDLFDAARVSLGALGVVTRMTVRTRAPYRLKARSWIEPWESVLEHFDESAARHRHFEMFPLTHSDYAITLAIDETDEPLNNPPVSPEEDAAFDEIMRGWMQLPPAERRPVINATAEQIEPSERVDASWKILSNVRNNRFNEMEYSVPWDAGAECLREILHTVAARNVDVVFPLEYRYVSGDDLWLSMSYGAEPHAAISIHRAASEDYRPYFELIEPIFWKYEGRPHWGKIHSLGHAELRRLYPRFDDFTALRAELDPAGRLLNDHLRRIFGVDA
jgi:FAD-linked oxidoreductase